MRPYVKIKDHNNLIRDTRSQAILQTDPTVVRKHEKRILELQEQAARDQEINNIKTELSEIKNLLHQLLRH